MRFRISLLLSFVWLLAAGSLPAQQKAIRLPSVKLKEQVIWGSGCDGPDGGGLSFGGQDQKADDGQPHTQIKVDGAWQAIHEELRAKNVLQKLHDRARELAQDVRAVAARLRHLYFTGKEADAEAKALRADVAPAFDKVAERFRALIDKDLKTALPSLKGYEKQQAEVAVDLLGRSLVGFADATKQATDKGTSAALFATLTEAARRAEMAADALDAEPPARALSPIVWDEKAKLYVLFGGDHLDYLMNDTWTFDPVRKQWQQRWPKTAPTPRANHVLKAADGKVTLSGGYVYTSETGYVSAQYREIGDGDWTYDVAANTWTGPADGVEPNQRVYRTGPFDPDYFLQAPKPDAAAFQKQLQEMPANTWVSTKPPRLPRLNRDWGTAVLDTDRDLILRFSGGHSAHGGSDVPHFHLATNRWELPFPVEFPLGQLYSNTDFPEGFNFNRRPWVTGHTYQNYGYDPVFKKMLFSGHMSHSYIYDPEVGDWTGRLAKPKPMAYGSCFYTLTTTPTPRGLVCWTQNGDLFRFDADKREWLPLALKGDKLPGSVVDNSTVVHDAKRDRLLFFRKTYGDKTTFDGQVQAVDLKTMTVSTLSPQGMEAAGAITYLCQLRYDAEHDLMLVGGTLPPSDDGIRRTAAYDCAANAWISFKLTGDDPSGKAGRNVSLGMNYDAARKRFWAVDTNSNVFVLRVDPKTADARPLK